MGNSGIEGVNFPVRIQNPERMSQLKTVRLAHAEAHPFTGKQFGGKNPHLGAKSDLSLGLADQSCCITGEAAGSIAAHLSLTAIGIVITHAQEFRRPFDGNQAISSNTTMAVAEAGDLVAIKISGAVTIINHDKVIPRAIHLGKLKDHGKSMKDK
jgi:hypothetical protein